MQLSWKGTGRQKGAGSREPVLCREAGMQELSPASHMSNGLCVLLQCSPVLISFQPRPSRSPVAPRSLGLVSSRFLVAVSTMLAARPGSSLARRDYLLAGNLFPLSLLLAKSLEGEPAERGVFEGGIGCAATAGSGHGCCPHSSIKGTLPRHWGTGGQGRPQRGMDSLLFPLGIPAWSGSSGPFTPSSASPNEKQSQPWLRACKNESLPVLSVPRALRPEQGVCGEGWHGTARR